MFQKSERDSAKGYQLLDLGSRWELHGPRGVYSGSISQVCIYAVTQLGFDIKELELAVIEMNNQFHNGAEFGIFKRFMWTFDLEEKYEKIASNC